MSNRKSFAERAYFYFSIFMILVYVLIGIMLIFVLEFLQIQSASRIAAGCVLIIYACYRTYKLISRQKSLAKSTDE
jgi:small neutral amino acid transporter SnatA (MarC family)